MMRHTDAGLAFRIAAVFAAFSLNLSAAEPRLAIENDHFTVNGTPRFLLLVSYFDALRAPDGHLESDFAWLQANGVNGVRIFPNWWDPTKHQFPDDTLLTADGSLRADRLARLKSILGCAAAHDMIVDISFAYEVVRGLSTLQDDQVGKSQGELPVNQVQIDAYERGLTAVAKELLPYRNFFIDIQNEFNGRVTHLDDNEVIRLARAIRGVDPDRIVTASLANEISGTDCVKRSVADGLDLVAWHESRNPWRYDTMDALMRDAKATTCKPIYLGEPASMEDTGLDTEAFLLAVSKARMGGAAAWTFHTEHGFDLHERSFRTQLTASETDFITQVAARLKAVSGGITSGKQ